MSSSGVYKKIGIASAIMMASVFLSRIIGLVREMIIAALCGAGPDVDAYLVGFIIPEILNHIVASGFASITFIPIFSKYMAQDREDQGWRVFSIIMTCFGTLLLFFIAVSFVFAPEFISLIARGKVDPLQFDKAVRMTRIVMPAQFFFFTGGMFMAVQFAKKKFSIPALAPLVYNLGIIAGGLLLVRYKGVEGFSWGALAGAFIGNFLLQWWGAKKVGMKFSPVFDFKDPDFIKYVLLTIPLMFGLTMTFSNEIFLKIFWAELPAGSLSQLNYSFRVVLSLAGLFGQAVGMAVFPFMASMVAENNTDEMNRLLNNILRFVSLVIPFSVLLMVLRYETVLILFERLQFDASATQITAGVLIFMLAGAFGLSVQTIVARGFYAMQNTIIPAILMTVAVFISLPFYWYGMKIMGVRGVALANSISITIQVIILYWVWNRRSNNRQSKAVYLFTGKIIILSFFIGIFLEWFKTTFLIGIDSATFTGSIIVSVIVGVMFILILAAAGYILKIEEILIFLRSIAKGLKAKEEIAPKEQN
jgi:putative peptidoglycan lipid II flippase